MTFEEWWTEPDPQTGNSYQDVYGDASGIVRLAFEAGQRAERERVEALQAEESPFHQVLCTGEGCTECARCERVAAAIRNRKEQG